MSIYDIVSPQESANGPVKKSMREKAIERRTTNKEHNSNFKAGYIPIEEERLHKTGLRGRKGSLAICVIVLLFLLALINLIVSDWNVGYTVFLSFIKLHKKIRPELLDVFFSSTAQHMHCVIAWRENRYVIRNLKPLIIGKKIRNLISFF